MGRFNREGKAKKDLDFVTLQQDIKYENIIPPQTAELVKEGIQQILDKVNKPADS
jgi:hypothetical protein